MHSWRWAELFVLHAWSEERCSLWQESWRMHRCRSREPERRDRGGTRSSRAACSGHRPHKGGWSRLCGRSSRRKRARDRGERNPEIARRKSECSAPAQRAAAAGRFAGSGAKYEQWGVPLATPYALDEAGTIMVGLRQTFPAPGVLGARSRAAGGDAGMLAKYSVAPPARHRVRVKRVFYDYYPHTTSIGSTWSTSPWKATSSSSVGRITSRASDAA